MLIALTRQVSPRIVECELTHIPRVPVDYARTVRQHREYEAALREAGCRVVSLPPEPDLADSVFVEDVAVVFDEVALLARPGVESRRPEVEKIAPALREYRELLTIEAPGTLEGGDVLRIGRTVYVGLSGRTNQAGFDQLRAGVSRHGYSAVPVEVRGCLHLKSAVTQVAADTVLINPGWVTPATFGGIRAIEVDPGEAYGANGLRVGDGLIYPTSFPRTQERLLRLGIQVLAVDVSELQKAEGAVTCCSLVFVGT